MTDIYDRVEILKKEILSPDTPDERKAKILDYLKEYNDVFLSSKIVGLDIFSLFGL